jgi:hypothetical protein
LYVVLHALQAKPQNILVKQPKRSERLHAGAYPTLLGSQAVPMTPGEPNAQPFFLLDKRLS